MRHEVLPVRNKDTVQAVVFFAIVIAAALSLAMIFAVVAAKFVGVPGDLSQFLVTTLLIAACVAGPLAALAAQNQYQTAKHHAELEALAMTDPLTGLLNRRSLERHAEEEIERMKRIGYPACVIIFDLDHFKSVNDTHGHIFGDRMLKDVAQRAQSLMRSSFDRLSRWGGEEFVLLLSNVEPAQAQNACERLRKGIEELVWKRDNVEIRITASFGIAPLSTRRGLEASLSTADAMLYQAKKTGRNRVVWTRGIRTAA